MQLWPSPSGWTASRVSLPFPSVSRMSGPTRQHNGDPALPLYMAAGGFSMIPLDPQLRPTWLFAQTVHEGCDRGGYYEQADFADEYGSPLCIVKLGCWGPVVQCNVGKRGWMGGIGGCPNVGGICIGCTMPGFPDKFMPFMNGQPPGSLLSASAVQTYGKPSMRFGSSPRRRSTMSLAGGPGAVPPRSDTVMRCARRGRTK